VIKDAGFATQDQRRLSLTDNRSPLTAQHQPSLLPPTRPCSLVVIKISSGDLSERPSRRPAHGPVPILKRPYQRLDGFHRLEVPQSFRCCFTNIGGSILQKADERLFSGRGLDLCCRLI
jgi:hypothetical protein